MELFGTVHEDPDYVVFEDKDDIKITRVIKELGWLLFYQNSVHVV